MKQVYGVWRIWFDCDGYRCETLDSIWKCEEDAKEYAKEETRNNVYEAMEDWIFEEYCNEYFDGNTNDFDDDIPDDFIDEFIKKLDDDDFNEYNADYFEVCIHDVQPKKRRRKSKYYV